MTPSKRLAGGLALALLALSPLPAAATTCGSVPPAVRVRGSDLVILGRVIPDSVVEARVDDKDGDPILRTEALLHIDQIEKGWPKGGRQAPLRVVMETIRPEDDDLALGLCGPHLFEDWLKVRYYLERPERDSDRYQLIAATALEE